MRKRLRNYVLAHRPWPESPFGGCDEWRDSALFSVLTTRWVLVQRREWGVGQCPTRMHSGPPPVPLPWAGPDLPVEQPQSAVDAHLGAYLVGKRDLHARPPATLLRADRDLHLTKPLRTIMRRRRYVMRRLVGRCEGDKTDARTAHD